MGDDVFAVLQEADTLIAVLQGNFQKTLRGDAQNVMGFGVGREIGFACGDNDAVAALENGDGIESRLIDMNAGADIGGDLRHFLLPHAQDVALEELGGHEEDDRYIEIARRKIGERADDVHVLHEVEKKNDVAPASHAAPWAMAASRRFAACQNGAEYSEKITPVSGNRLRNSASTACMSPV